MRIRRILCALAAVALLTNSGCALVSKMTIASTKNVDLTAKAERTGERKSDTNSRLWILFIPFGRKPNIDRAMDTALQRGDGDFLTNVEIKQGGWSLLGLVSWGSVSVEGDVWRTTDQAASAPRPRGNDVPGEQLTD